MERSSCRGVDIDRQTRCTHYHSELDIVAIKLACCSEYYACYECHKELAGHEAQPWRNWDEPAVLCGNCGLEMTPRSYMSCDSKCPLCGAGFNPGCKAHWPLYFGEEQL